MSAPPSPHSSRPPSTPGVSTSVATTSTLPDSEATGGTRSPPSSPSIRTSDVSTSDATRTISRGQVTLNKSSVGAKSLQPSSSSPLSANTSDASTYAATTSTIPYSEATGGTRSPPSSPSIRTSDVFASDAARTISHGELTLNTRSVGAKSSQPSSAPHSASTLDISTPDTIETTSGSEETMSACIIERRRIRAFRRSVIRAKVPEDVVKRVIKLYDLEGSYSEQPEGVIDEVEQMLGMRGIEWSSQDERLGMIWEKTVSSVETILKSYGYKTFAHFGQDGKARLEIGPAPGKEPPPLPEWLQIPYLVPVKGYDSRLVFDACANPTTRNGDALYDQTERPVGTLGAVMLSSRPGRAETYVVLTAGHVIPDGEDRLLVKNRKLDTFISLRVAKKFRRFDGRPLHRQGLAPSFQDDVGILSIEKDDLGHFSRRIANLNLHLNPPNRALSIPEMTDPVDLRRRTSIVDLLSYGPIIVHKVGASTDLTTGRFMKILRETPEGWYEDTRSNLEEAEMDDNEWLGLVAWMDTDTPFTDSGDSGSLVFMRDGGIHIPLGIHVGSPDNKNESIFISLETFCFEAESEGLTLHFDY